MMISKKLIQDVEIRLASYLSESNKGNLKKLEILQTIERGFSTVVFFRAHTDKQHFDAVLKKVVHHQENITLTKKENQAVVEYNMISYLHPFFESNNECSVPGPIAVFPEDEAYLMEFVPGCLLNEKLKAARYISLNNDFAALKKWYYLCGRWLRRFQEVTEENPGGLEIFETTLTRCEEKLDIIQDANDPRCPSDLKQRILSDLNNELAKIEGKSVLTAGRHGDFGGWNILAHGDGITVFDFLGSQPDSIAVDVLKMLVNFEDEAKYILYSKKRIEMLKNQFLEGYGKMPEIQRPVAVICETLHRVCSLCAAVLNRDAMGLRRKYEKKLSFDDHLKWLLSDKKKLMWKKLKES